MERMEEREPEIGAYLTVTAESALEAAGCVDADRAPGDALPLLAGIPMGLKDNICTKGERTTLRPGCWKVLSHPTTPPWRNRCGRAAR